SACSTSQSMAIEFSPSALRSTAARSARPTRREISWVRPPILPRTDSLSLRVRVARGSIAYSAVTQPRPLPLRQRGTPCLTDAAHRTLVSPNSTRADPSAYACQLRVMVTGRSWSLARLSGRGILRPYRRSPTTLRGAPGCDPPYPSAMPVETLVRCNPLGPTEQRTH